MCRRNRYVPLSDNDYVGMASRPHTENRFYQFLFCILVIFFLVLAGLSFVNRENSNIICSITPSSPNVTFENGYSWTAFHIPQGWVFSTLTQIQIFPLDAPRNKSDSPMALSWIHGEPIDAMNSSLDYALYPNISGKLSIPFMSRLASDTSALLQLYISCDDCTVSTSTCLKRVTSWVLYSATIDLFALQLLSPPLEITSSGGDVSVQGIWIV